MYQLVKTPITNEITTVRKENSFIPFDPANTDYQQFKKHLAEGGELQDAEGQVMTPEAVQAFVATLP